MPVSHLGLTVSHIPSSTSFYLAALQPLGYRYIGQQGESIGLGVIDADFFLCQQQHGTRVSPTHIAFAANSRLTVRDCYAAALNAGARPSGAPSYRNDDCSCFNAAVDDLDGNTVEFIFREPCESGSNTAPFEYRPVQSSQEAVSRSGVKDDVQTLASNASRTRSRGQTALDLASTTSKSMKKSEAPAPGITRSRREPVTSMKDNGGKAVVGTLLGAAAGAAFAYAMYQSERDNARDEAAFASSMRAKAPSLKHSRTQSNYEKSSVSAKPSSVRSSRHPPRSMRAIEPARYDDNEVQDAISQYTSSRRPMPQRSQTYDAIEYRPMSSHAGHSDRYSAKRSSTLPLDTPNYYLEGPTSMPASRHTSRRGSIDDRELKRHDSGVSMNSHRSRGSGDGGPRSSMSKASTAKPSRRGSSYESAANMPLPSSKATSKAPTYYSAAQMPLPDSRPMSYISAAQLPIPSSYANGGYTDLGEESDGLGDMQSVVPDDSISCVDFSKPKKSKSSSKSSRHSSKRSEAASDRTVRPAKQSGSRHSAMTLPMRTKEDYYISKGGKRSTHTYA